MTRELVSGSKLNEIAGSLLRRPGFQVLAYNPLLVSLNDLAEGTPPSPPKDISAFVESIQYTENIGFENGDDPAVTQCSFQFKRNPVLGLFRRGWIEDGVLVRVLAGDMGVAREEWTVVFTGTFRGRPGDNQGSRADLSEGLTATAYGREERYLNLEVTTESMAGPVDTGAIAYEIARKYMGLRQNEIRFGAVGFETLHQTNQLVEIPALQALYECFFPAGKKPKFNALGQLVAVDVDLDKPPARIFSDGDFTIRSLVASPNDVEVNNQVILRGLDYRLTRTIQEAQLLTELDITSGFFDSSLNRPVFYSQDHSQRAQDTFLIERSRMRFSNADWTEVDEFHGRLSIDTHYLRNVRAIIFGTYLALQLAVALLDLIADQATGTFTAILRFILQVASQLALAALLWSMNFIGRGHYEGWGRPFEYVYQEIVSDSRLVGLDPEELRRWEYRNDFIGTIEDLDTLGRTRLRREMIKNQLFEIQILDDPLLEVDDTIETVNGSRYYILSVNKTFKHGDEPVTTLTCWKVYEDFVTTVKAEQAAAAARTGGYGSYYGLLYGRGL
jgi:hypothetical protein